MFVIDELRLTYTNDLRYEFSCILYILDSGFFNELLRTKPSFMAFCKIIYLNSNVFILWAMYLSFNKRHGTLYMGKNYSFQVKFLE